jgi:hypothetical protein
MNLLFSNNLGKKSRKPRRAKLFSSLSASGKRSAAADIRKSAQPDAIMKAARQIAMRQSNKDMAFLMKKMYKYPALATRMRKFLNFQMTKLSPPEALSFLLQKHLSVSSYKAFRELVKEHGADLLPSYDAIQAEKKKCRPAGTVIEEYQIFTPLQSILDKSMDRLFEDQDFQSHVSNMADQSGDGPLKVKVFFKIGIDGTGGFAEFHQHSEDPDQEAPPGVVLDEKTILASQMVLVRMETSNRDTIWQNSLVNSASAARPVRLSHEKETLGN